jgi:SH3 domain-containing YSC84-like protein 1
LWQNDKWTDPGPIVFLLMKQNAVGSFRTSNNLALSADTGLSIVTYSAEAQASWGKGDVFMWSDNPGRYAGANVSVFDIACDTGNNHNYYGDDPTVAKILSGSAKNVAEAKDFLQGLEISTPPDQTHGTQP